jgi:hypothetical protein
VTFLLCSNKNEEIPTVRDPKVMNITKDRPNETEREVIQFCISQESIQTGRRKEKGTLASDAMRSKRVF